MTRTTTLSASPRALSVRNVRHLSKWCAFTSGKRKMLIDTRTHTTDWYWLHAFTFVLTLYVQVLSLFTRRTRCKMRREHTSLSRRPFAAFRVLFCNQYSVRRRLRNVGEWRGGRCGHQLIDILDTTLVAWQCSLFSCCIYCFAVAKRRTSLESRIQRSAGITYSFVCKKRIDCVEPACNSSLSCSN